MTDNQGQARHGPKSKHVVIVGGGISGLSAAWYLQKSAQEEGLDLEYTVLEQSDRWGGKVLTETVDGYGHEPFVVEGGPDSFLTQKPWALQLARELGLEDRIPELIEKDVIVKMISDNYIGCEFIEETGFADRTLGFYLMK